MLTLTMATGVTAFADIKTPSGTERQNVTVKTNTREENATTYYVAVSWGSLDFEYEFKTRRWNPTAHTYTADETDPGWKKNTSWFKVTNHSNVAVNVDMRYDKGASDYGVSGSITGGYGSLESAVGKSVTEADSLTATLTIDGAPTENLTTATAVGSVLIWIYESSDGCADSAQPVQPINQKTPPRNDPRSGAVMFLCV